MGYSSRRPLRQHADRWNFRTDVGGTAMASKAAHEAKAPRPFCGLNRGILCPLQGQANTNMLSMPRLHESDESGQQQAGIVHLEAQAASQVEIFLERLSNRVHRAPPGQAIANFRSALTSTLA